MFDTKLKLRYLLSDLKILTQKIRVSSSVTNNDQLILVDPVDDEDVEDLSTDWSSLRGQTVQVDLVKVEDPGPRTLVGLQLWQGDLKKRKN